MADGVTQEGDPDAGRPHGESVQDVLVAQLQAELEASLSAGFVPSGWTRQISWEPRGKAPGVAIAIGALIVVGGAVAGWLFWGWEAALASGMVAIGVVVLLSMRSGPRPGDTITESFTPPDETLLELGIAGHELVQVTQSRPSFSQTRQATRGDRRGVRLGQAAIGASFAFGGILTLLVESDQISAGASLRAGSIAGAVVCVVFAVWYWRLIGRYMHAFASAKDSKDESLTKEVLDTATTGKSSLESLGHGLFSRLPLRAARVVGPALILLTGALGVLVAFALAPDSTGLWSSALAAADLVVFTVAGLRALMLVGMGLILADLKALGVALWDLLVMGALLLIAHLFGWLDEWAAVISWIRSWIS